ncbi:MAG: DMT family transporter [Flavobacteriales bacterium]|nr:DMT family transporter [Flavobacteriales bacterium]MCB9193978.1 DMT family transporter [Flavobacteriales bacterium]
MDRPHRNALLLLHFTVLIWGLTGIFGRLIKLPADQLVYIRTLIGMAGLAMAAPIMRFPLRPGADLRQQLLTGVIIAGHWLSFYGAIKLATVSVAVACLAASTIFTALLEPIWSKRGIRGYEVVLGVVVIAALFLIFGLETTHRWGIAVATLSALLAAWFTVINGQLIKRDHAGRIGFYELGGATVAMGIWLAIDGRLPMPLWRLPSTDVLYLLLLGLLCTSFAFVAGIAVMRQLSAFTVSLTVNLEPVYSILLALLIWGEDERLHWGSYVGFVLILAALFINGWLQQRARTPRRTRLVRG